MNGDICRDTAAEVLAAARERDYAGYSKFDALNSPVLDRWTFGSKWPRILVTQLVNRSPVHLRPLLGVRRSRNPKGIALFAHAYLLMFRLTGNGEYLDEAERLLDWLMQNTSPGHRNACWGYNFLWQSPIFLQDRNEPNAVVTTFVGEALVQGYRVTGKDEYLRAARSAAGFILYDLPVLYDKGDERAIAYVTRPVGSVVLNNQVLTGALLVKVWKHTHETALLDTAVRQYNYTVRRRTDYDAWYYTHPRGKSPITHDNYHTGGILDALLEFAEETGDGRFDDVYWRGLEFYRDRLFEPDGAPRWMHDRRYPYDVHGSAQGIISFTKAARHRPAYAAEAVKAADWSLKRLYRREQGDFAYRRGRFFTWNYSLMRWCNAWMARALAELAGLEGCGEK